MTLLTFIAVVPIIVVAVLLLTAILLDEASPAFIAFLIAVFWAVAMFAFNSGAKWQHAHTLENYTLSPK